MSNIDLCKVNGKWIFRKPELRMMVVMKCVCDDRAQKGDKASVGNAPRMNFG